MSCFLQRVLIVGVGAGLLAACGFKGPLYLPAGKPAAAVKPSPALPADKAPVAKP